MQKKFLFAYEDKPEGISQHPDDSGTMYLVAPDAIEAFVENLPKRDELKLVISPALLMSHEPFTTTPAP